MSTVPSTAAPIGVFDSGIGGISIARCIEHMLPNEHLIYFADSKFAPYGDITIQAIINRVNSVADFLILQGVKAIVVACNTATVNAIDQLRARINIPIIGVEPAIKPAVIHSKNRQIGLLVTRATASNERFLTLVKKHKADTEVYIQPCPGLVQLIEQGKHHTETCHDLLQSFISPLIDKQIDTLVLGCTHYPLVAEQIQQITGKHITLIETAKPVTEELKRRLSDKQLLSSTRRHKHHIVISSSTTKLLPQAISSFWSSNKIFIKQKDI